jgi:hypothetical protein
MRLVKCAMPPASFYRSAINCMEITLDRALAEGDQRKLKALDEPLNNLMAAVETIIDVEQRREFRLVVAGLVATVYTDL